MTIAEFGLYLQAVKHVQEIIIEKVSNYSTFRPHRGYLDAAIVTDGVASSDGLPLRRSVTIVSPAKAAEQIEMPFGMLNEVDPRKHVLDGVPGEYD